MTALLIGGFVAVSVALMVWWVWLIEYRTTDVDDPAD